MTTRQDNRLVILSFAFRVFFLLGSAMSIVAIALWMLALLGTGPIAGTPTPAFWHAHEMIYGFAAPIVAGFALTAVAVWTDRPPLRNAPLAWLTFAWLCGRVAMLFAANISQVVPGLIDACFLIGLAVLLAREVMLAGNTRNFIVVAMVAVLATSDALFHFGMVTSPVLAREALVLGVLVILLLVAVIAGRIIPAFTGNWLRQRGTNPDHMPRGSLSVDIASILATLAAGAGIAFAPLHTVTGALCFVAAALHLLRLSRWSGLQTVGEPLLFVLHIAYLWFPIGFALAGLAAFSMYPMSVALHALTMGVIGMMIFAMITRVSLGHTGRPLHASRLIVLAYVLLFVTVLVRLSGPLVGNAYMLTVTAASLIWMLVFAVFLWVYWPILTQPAPDAQAQK